MSFINNRMDRKSTIIGNLEKVCTCARNDCKKLRNVFRPAKNNILLFHRLVRIETNPKKLKPRTR